MVGSSTAHHSEVQGLEFLLPLLSVRRERERGMREIQLPLNKTQKIRLQKALEKLESLSTKVNYDASVTVADSIHVNHEDGVLKGHGTADLNGEVVATLCGVVERVNKLVYVRALRSRLVTIFTSQILSLIIFVNGIM